MGYNNGVFLLNDICEKHYSNSKLGVKARSINLKDIEDHFTDEAKTTRDAYTSGGIKYGDTKIIEYYTYTPDIYKYVSQDNAGESVNYYPEATIETYRQETDLVVKQTNYILAITKEKLDTEMMHLLLFKNIGSGNSHFIASRSTNLNGEIASFRIRNITSGLIRSQKLYGSNNVESESGELGLRPIVRLNRDVQISELGGTAAMPRTLSR